MDQLEINFEEIEKIKFDNKTNDIEYNENFQEPVSKHFFGFDLHLK